MRLLLALVIAAPMAACGDEEVLPLPKPIVESDDPHCGPVSSWKASRVALEEQVLRIVNERRAAGTDCPGQQRPALPPLSIDERLRCAARLHSTDMAENSFFDHINLAGDEPWKRMADAGYEFSAAGENIAMGQSTSLSVMDSWMRSSGHCANIMGRDYLHIGIGYHPGTAAGPHVWTQVFGSP